MISPFIFYKPVKSSGGYTVYIDIAILLGGVYDFQVTIGKRAGFSSYSSHRLNLRPLT
jgi:hypothetical protein